MENIFLIVICHLIGDYVLQSDFIATTKGSNWYHLFVHCALYVVPFYAIIGESSIALYGYAYTIYNDKKTSLK